MSHQQPSPADEGSDGYDPNKAFEQRRSIYLNVQEIQRLEHEAINRIAKVTQAKKGELLKILSDWLMKQTVYHSEHREAESLSGCDMREWLRLQKEAEPLEVNLNRCEREVQTAGNNYKDAAPLGHVGLGVVNEWWADGEKKTHLQNLSAVSRSKNAARDEATRLLNANIAARQRFGKRFLRGCLSNLPYLEASSVFGSRARTITGDMTRTLETEWLNYKKLNHSAMASLDNSLYELRRIYGLKGE